MNTVKITDEFLNRLRMLADWQIKEMGFDPDSITEACSKYDEQFTSPWHKRAWLDSNRRATTVD